MNKKVIAVIGLILVSVIGLILVFLGQPIAMGLFTTSDQAPLTWSIEAVDSAGDVGGYTSIALDSGDNPHISYFDIANWNLNYANAPMGAMPKHVVHLKGAAALDVQLQAVIDNFTDIEWLVVYGDLTANDLDDAEMLFMVQADPTTSYTLDELNAVKGWYETGYKTIWVAGDSDYGQDRLRQQPANEVLEKIGSVLRIESCSAEDPKSSAGLPFRVLGVTDNCDPELNFLVSSVNRALFHGPGIITAYSDGRYYKLEDEKPPGVYRIMSTTSGGVVVDHSEPPPEAHVEGEEGSFVLMAMEIDEDFECLVIATGDAPFNHYIGMYMPELLQYNRFALEYPQEGAVLFENIIRNREKILSMMSFEYHFQIRPFTDILHLNVNSGGWLNGISETASYYEPILGKAESGKVYMACDLPAGGIEMSFIVLDTATMDGYMYRIYDDLSLVGPDYVWLTSVSGPSKEGATMDEAILPEVTTRSVHVFLLNPWDEVTYIYDDDAPWLWGWQEVSGNPGYPAALLGYVEGGKFYFAADFIDGSSDYELDFNVGTISTADGYAIITSDGYSYIGPNYFWLTPII